MSVLLEEDGACSRKINTVAWGFTSRIPKMRAQVGVVCYLESSLDHIGSSCDSDLLLSFSPAPSPSMVLAPILSCGWQPT